MLPRTSSWIQGVLLLRRGWEGKGREGRKGEEAESGGTGGEGRGGRGKRGGLRHGCWGGIRPCQPPLTLLTAYEGGGAIISEM